MPMTLDDLKRVMAEIPDLTRHGFGLYGAHGMTKDEYEAKMIGERAELLSCIDRCTAIADWLDGVNSVEHVNPSALSSYHWKHLAENDVGYVANGDFIAAAVFKGFKFERCDESSLNAWFNFSRRSELAIRRRQEAARLARADQPIAAWVDRGPSTFP